MTDRFTEIGHDPCRTCRRNSRYQHVVVREALGDRAYQRHGSLHLADGNRVYPDALVELGVTDAEALPQPITIGPVK